MASRSIFRSFLAGIYSQVALSVTQILLVPVFLHYWGETGYGHWLVVLTIVSHISLSDFGLTSTASNLVTMHAAAGEYAAARRVVQSLWVYQIVIGAVVMLLGGLCVAFAPLHALLGIPREASAAGFATLVGLLFYALLSLQCGVYLGPFRALGCNARFVTLTGTFRLLEGICTAVALAIGFQAGGIAWVLVAVKAGQLLWSQYDIFKIAPNLMPGFREARWQVFRGMLASGAGFMAMPIGNLLSNQVSIVVINHLLGPFAVVTISVLRQVARFLPQAAGLVTNAFWPDLSRLHAERNIEALRKYDAFLFQSGLVIAVFGVAGFLGLGPLFISYYTTKKVAIDYALAVPIAISAGGACIWGVLTCLPAAINKHMIIACSFLVLTGASLLLYYPVTHSTGLVGIAWLIASIDILMIPVAVAQNLIQINLSLNEAARNSLHMILHPAAIVTEYFQLATSVVVAKREPRNRS